MSIEGNKSLERLIEDIFLNDPDKIKGITDIEVPDMDKMMAILKMDDNNNRKIIKPVFRVKKNRLLKNLIIAVSICLFTFAISILWDVPYAKAVKFRLVKTFYNIKDNIITVMHKDSKDSPSNSNSNDSINKDLSMEQIGELPFHLYVPQYIPKYYNLNNITWMQYPDNMHVVQQIYIEENNSTITIIQTENRPEENIETYIKSENGTVDVVEINGYDVTLISTNSDMTNAIWYKSDTKFEVIACINKNETINIIKSLK